MPLVPVDTKEEYSLSESDSAFVYLRNPDLASYDRKTREGWLRLYPSTVTIKDLKSPSYVGLRQSSMDFTLSVTVEEALKENEKAGLVVIQNDRYSVRLVVKI